MPGAAMEHEERTMTGCQCASVDTNAACRQGCRIAEGRPETGLILLQAGDAATLRTQVSNLLKQLQGLASSAFAGFIRQRAGEHGHRHSEAPRGDGKPWRAALVAATPCELWIGLCELLAWLDEGRPRGLDPRGGVYLGHAVHTPRIAFLFPGQTAPVSFDGGHWGERFPAVREVFGRPVLPGRGDPNETATAQPYIIAAQLAGLAILNRCGLHADLALGHSLGELTALHWAGAYDATTLMRVAVARGHLMGRSRGGAMCHIVAPISELYWVMEPNPKVVVSCINGPDSTVLSGPVAAVEAVAARARRRGWTATRLRVQGAFHSPAMLPAANALAPMLTACQVSALRRPVISTSTASLLSPTCNLRSHLLKHITEPVRFIEAMDQVATSADLCIEVGSGSILSHCVDAWLDLPVLPLDVAGDSIDGLVQVLATAYVHGADIDPTALTAGRPAVTFKALSTPPIQTIEAGHPGWGTVHRAGVSWRPMPQ
jgi:enediyne polyketide synthase